MLQAIRQIYPEAKIDLITDSEFGTDALLNNAEFIDKVISLPKDASLADKQELMNRLDYDVLFIPFDACPSFLHKMAIQSPIKRIIRHRQPEDTGLKSLKNKVKESLWPRTTFVPLIAGRHETLLNLDLLYAWKEVDMKTEFETSISLSHESDVLSTYGLIENDYILLQPGAANGEDPTKTWHPDNWIHVIHWLLENTSYPIVICGDKGDRKNHIAPIVNQIENERLIDSSGKTSITDLISLVFHSHLLLCHDSGTMHIADALSKKLITLFGPSDSSRTKPLRSSSRILFSKTEYFNTKYNFKAFNVSDLKEGQSVHYPMSGIQTEEMIENIKDILFNQ